MTTFLFTGEPQFPHFHEIVCPESLKKKKKTLIKCDHDLKYFFFFWSRDKVSPDWPEIHYVDKADFELSEICLLSSETKGVHGLAWPPGEL